MMYAIVSQSKAEIPWPTANANHATNRAPLEAQVSIVQETITAMSSRIRAKEVKCLGSQAKPTIANADKNVGNENIK